MMKQEFEQLIGKEVTTDIFEMYERMYNVLPENVNKQQFVSMLNLANIPENPEAICRREENQRRIEEIKAQIVELREEYKEENSELAKSLYPTYSKRRRQEIRQRIKELKALL